MPHQCTNCGRAFADGSKEMLSGCPDCGGNKFQFQPKSAGSTPAESTDSSPDRTESTSDGPDATGTTERDESARPDPSPPTSERADRAWPGTDSEPSPDAGSPSANTSSSPASPTEAPGTESPPAPTASSNDTPQVDAGTSTGSDADVDADTEASNPPRVSDEDHAQASARTDMVTPDELADAARKTRKPPDDVDGQVIEPQSDDRPGLDELREELNSQFESIKIVSPGQYELNLMELYDRQEYIISLQEDGRYVIEVPDSWGSIDER